MINYSKTDEELIEKTNEAIAELVYPKWELQKAYNYYNGKRDAEQYRYLEENYGIGTPTSVEFTPLVRKHIDVLVGEYMSLPINPKISCKDDDTISNITREKQLVIQTQVLTFLKQRLYNKIFAFIQNGKKDQIIDPYIKEETDKLLKELDQSFVSSYETAAQDVIQYVIQSRTTDFSTKLKTLILDLLITGYNFYEVHRSPSGSNIQIETLSPLNVFPDRNPESPYIKDSYRIVVRRWMSPTQILNRYGKDLTKEEIEDIKSEWKQHTRDESYYFVRAMDGVKVPSGINQSEVVIPGFPESYSGKHYNYDLIPVYEVQWLEVDEKYVMHRQSTIRIGEEIYIINEVDKDVIRSIDDPNKCDLSVNGVYFLNRNAEPYSLMLACMHLQDKYDLLHFYRDNLIAQSGTAGDWVDISMIPKNLGVNFPERIQKWLAYKKAGTGLIDSSQEGRLSNGGGTLNTIFNGFDDTAKLQAVQAIQLAIESVENTASSITGVFRERLNGIQQRDAVSNIQAGANNSFIITKQYYHQMDLITEEMLLECLNLAKKVWKKGLTGTIILGDKKIRVFTALPEHYTLTDFDLRIDTSSETLQDLQVLKQNLPSLIQGQILPANMIMELLTSRNLPDLKYKVKHAIKEQEKKNDIVAQLQQQGQQLQEQLQQAQNQLKQYENQIQQMDKAKLELEKQKLQAENQINWFKAQTDRTYKEAATAIDKKRTEIELLQLHDGNPYNDTIKQL